MKTLYHTYCCFIIGFISCSEPVVNIDLLAQLSLQNNCDQLFELSKTDSIQVVMRFFDKDSIPIIDADVIKLNRSGDSVFTTRLRLKKSDQWIIKDITTKSGYPFCSGCLSDTVLVCRMEAGETGLGRLRRVEDTIHIQLACRCR